MFQTQSPTSTDAQTPPLTSHRGCNEIKGRGNLLNTVSSPSPSFRRLSSSVRRSTHTTLREKPGSGGQGPGTQQLSREAKLAISVLIDLIGMSSYTVPGLGELSDLGWAPISSALVLYLYGNSIFAGLAFVEEILPGLDFIPTATIAWFLTNSEVGKNVTNAASGKARGSDTSKASSDWFRWGTPSSVSSGEGETAKPDRNRRDVDPDLIKSGVIDVDGD
ncbi:unnamed protein product [Ascophyllum nodosum]